VRKLCHHLVIRTHCASTFKVTSEGCISYGCVVDATDITIEDTPTHSTCLQSLYLEDCRTNMCEEEHNQVLQFGNMLLQTRGINNGKRTIEVQQSYVKFTSEVDSSTIPQ